MKYQEQWVQISSVRSYSDKDNGFARGNLFQLGWNNKKSGEFAHV